MGHEVQVAALVRFIQVDGRWSNLILDGQYAEDRLYRARRTLLTDSFATIPETATLADAKSALEGMRGREDVFVTRTGARDEAVLGWLTDNAIVRHSRA